MLNLLLMGMLAAHVVASPATRPGVGPRRGIAGGGPVGTADSVVIEKKRRRLTLYHMGHPFKRFRIALGKQPVGDKVSRGDWRTPEGVFSIAGRNANSEYHLSLRISYPDERHRARAEKLGLDPGGDIMIHGLPNGRGRAGSSHRSIDWTNGCIALTDEEIEELWSIVPIGTPVQIKP